MPDSSICNPLTDGMKKGDVFTMEGRYRRRNLWEWLTNKPRELQLYRLGDDYRAGPGGITPYEQYQ